jgi:hypothetical protein
MQRKRVTKELYKDFMETYSYLNFNSLPKLTCRKPFGPKQVERAFNNVDVFLYVLAKEEFKENL